jgi:hypothetical protein
MRPTLVKALVVIAFSKKPVIWLVLFFSCDVRNWQVWLLLASSWSCITLASEDESSVHFLIASSS